MTMPQLTLTKSEVEAINMMETRLMVKQQQDIAISKQYLEQNGVKLRQFRYLNVNTEEKKDEWGRPLSTI